MLRKSLQIGKYLRINIPKTAGSDVQKPQSNLIIQPLHFKQSGIFNGLVNRFKNNNAIFQIKRNVSNYSNEQFQKQALQKYKQVQQLYHNKNYKQIDNFIVPSLLKKFKNICKHSTHNNKNNNNVNISELEDLGWTFIANPTAAKIVQARIHQQKISTFNVTDRWYQMTCRFTNSQGQQIYNVLEKHQKNKDFKFVKFGI